MIPLSQLTLAEKASLCLGADFWHTVAVPRLGIERIMVSDGPHGLRRQPEDQSVGAPSTPATCFPTASALGSSWNVELTGRVGQALGREARDQGVSVLLGPGVNIKRSPLCGRNFEYFSEDPVVSGALGAALVQGIQSQGVGACVKHFAANNQETDRLRVSAEVDERTLREIYLPAFEQVVGQARPWTVMCAYNKVNGTYASENGWLLSTVLRDEWGFDGLVMSDWGAVHDRVAALAAGLDLEMPPNLGVSDQQIIDAVQAGDLDEAVLDAAVTRVLALVDRALEAAGAVGGGGSPDQIVDADQQHELARAAARECAVLLKNDVVGERGGLDSGASDSRVPAGGVLEGGVLEVGLAEHRSPVLPLQPAPGSRIAVIGEFARTPRYQGAGSSEVNPTRVDVPLDELRTLAPEGVTLDFAPGFTLDGNAGPAPAGLGQAGSEPAESELAAEALALAAGADAVLLFLGLPVGEESEGFDRTHLDLPAAQLGLLARLAEVNPRIAVILANGSVVSVAGWQSDVAAILECWLSGQGAGRAVAELVFGVVNPSGKLAETIPLRLEDNPSYLNFPGDSGQVRYGEGIFVGYRGYDARDQAVAYSFGHGLSYTEFGYGELTTGVQGNVEDGDLAVTIGCRITNTGSRAGQEIVQLYVRDVRSGVSRPVRELKGFAKVALAPGESTSVEFVLGERDLAFWSVAVRDWVVEAGVFEFSVGASSRDLRLSAELEIDAPRIGTPLTAMSTLQEWLDDPEGAVLLTAAVGTDETGVARGIVGDPELIRVIGNFPISTLAAFPGLAIDEKTLRTILD